MREWLRYLQALRAALFEVCMRVRIRIPIRTTSFRTATFRSGTCCSPARISIIFVISGPMPRRRYCLELQ